MIPVPLLLLATPATMPEAQKIEALIQATVPSRDWLWTELKRMEAAR